MHWIMSSSQLHEAGSVIIDKEIEVNTLPRDHTANTQRSQNLNPCSLAMTPTLKSDAIYTKIETRMLTAWHLVAGINGYPPPWVSLKYTGLC